MKTKNSLSITNTVTISAADRSHCLISGLTGMGVSTLFTKLAQQDMQTEEQVILFDLYGDVTKKIMNSDLKDSVTVCEPGNGHGIKINAIKPESAESRNRVPERILKMLTDLYDPNNTGIMGPRFEHAIRNVIGLIQYDENPDFFSIVKALTSADYVKTLLPKVKDEVLLNYWNEQTSQTSDFHKSEVLDYIISKFTLFLHDPVIKQIVTYDQNGYDLGMAVSGTKHLIVNLEHLNNNPERIIIASHYILNTILDTLLDGTTNAEIPPRHIYVDQADLFSHTSISSLLRKSKRVNIDCTLSLNSIFLTDPKLQYELLKIQNLILFRHATADAKILVPELHSTDISLDMVCMLKRYSIVGKLVKNGNPVIVKEVALVD